MFKNQLQELAQRSCFNLPSYSCIREGPDHAPRFKAKVCFNGETFESPNFFSTLRQAEHASAEVALKALSLRGPSRALAARVLDETGVYKNLLQETAHRAGLNLPVYTTVRSGVGGVPHFACTVELAGMSFKGEPAKTKKQAQKNAAMSAWFSLKNLSMQDSYGSTSSESGGKEEQEQMSVARYLSKFKLPERRKPPSKPHSGKNDVIPYHANRRPGHQNYTYFPLSLEMASYQNWHHGVTLPRSYLLTSPPPPLPISGPQFFPFVQSIFGPYSFPSDPLVRSRPFLYMAGSEVAPSGPSRVRIEEIEEHNNQPEEKWLNKNVKTSNREDLVSWVNPGFLRNDTGPVTVGQPTIGCRNADYSRFLPPPCSTRRPPLFPPHETSHININAATLRVPRPWLEMNRVPCARAMAPAVQIRSVVPVCSAPGLRDPPHSQLASSASSFKPSEARRSDGTFDRISAVSSDFSRLQL